MASEVRVFHDHPRCAAQIAEGLHHYADTNHDIVFVCIGSTRCIGDAVGPFVGTYLMESGVPNVYGTLDDPVHATNLVEKLCSVRANHPRAFIVAVDACLGLTTSVGEIQMVVGSLRPGIGVGNDLPAVGDVAIGAIVNVQGLASFLILQNTTLSLVVRMAKQISEGINLWLSGACKQVAASQNEVNTCASES